MRIAYCFSGMLRTAEYTDNILHGIGNLKHQVDFFAHTWDTNFYRDLNIKSINFKTKYKDLFDAGASEDELKKLIIHPTPTTYEVLDKIKNAYKFRYIEVENQSKQMGDFHKQYGYYVPLWYSWWKSIQLKKHHEDLYGFKYDYVVKSRPDLFLHPEYSLEKELEHITKEGPGFYTADASAFRNTASDVYFIASSEIMDKVSEFCKHVTYTPEGGRLSIYKFANDCDIHVKPSYLDSIRSRYAWTLMRPEALSYDHTEFDKVDRVDKDWYMAPF
jgi:hypothetical protein